MRLKIRLALIAIIACVITIGSTSSPVYADGPVRTSVIATAGAPVTLTHCAASLDMFADLSASGSLINRSDVFLTSYVIRWYQYDHVGNLMMSEDHSYGFGTDLAPNDTASANPINLSGSDEPRSALSEVKCRLESAKFEGGLTWTYGRMWHRRLAPMPPAESQLDAQPGTNAVTDATKDPQQSDLSDVGVTVANAWDDSVNGNLFVHVALDVRASSAAATITPPHVLLKMKLADGKDRVFAAMSDAAPTYQKLDPLGQNSTTKTAFEVDPNEDLGKLGQVKIMADSRARIVATFAIGDVSVADPRDNKRVVLK
jgi:hypothetical protein